MSKNEKREKRRTGDESLCTPRTARLRVLSCRSAPSKPAHPLSARRLLRSASLAFPVVPPAKPACPAWSKASCAAISQAPFAHAHRPRCNTLHFAGQSRVPREALPPLETPATKPRFHWMLPASGELPLWTPLVRGTLFPLNPLANETKSVSLNSSFHRAAGTYSDSSGKAYRWLFLRLLFRQFLYIIIFGEL